MSTAHSRFLHWSVLVLGAAALSPFGAARAQQTVAATARLSSRPISQAGADSGKLVLSLKINGIPDVGLRNLRLDQIVLVDESGRAYTPFAYGFRSTGREVKDVLAAYITPRTERLADRQYIFLIPPGHLLFELRVAGLKPVPVAASLTGFSR